MQEAPSYLGPQLYPAQYERLSVWGAAQVSPAAGADVSITIPNGVAWRVVSLVATLTASAAAANRFVGFVVKSQDGTTVYRYRLTAALTANLTATYCFSPDVGPAPTAVATTNNLLLPKPDEVIPAGWTFGTSTLNIDTADQWSSVAVWAETLLPAAGE